VRISSGGSVTAQPVTELFKESGWLVVQCGDDDQAAARMTKDFGNMRWH